MELRLSVLSNFAANKSNVENEIKHPVALCNAVLQNHCPHFMIQFGHSFCKDIPCAAAHSMFKLPPDCAKAAQTSNPFPKNEGLLLGHHIFVYEYLQGWSIESSLKLGQYDDLTLITLQVQALLTLTTLHFKLRMAHYDAHWNNWFVQVLPSVSGCYQYQHNVTLIFLPNTGYKIKLIDYGMIQSENDALGPYNPGHANWYVG